MDRHATILPPFGGSRFRNRAHLVMLVEADEVRCTRTAHDRMEEERSTLPSLVFPRRGVFRHHVGRRATVADPNTVLLFHPDEPYRVSHPTDDGDDCVSLRFDRDTIMDALGFASESGRTWVPPARTQRALHAAAHAVLAAPDPFERDVRALEILDMLGAQPVVPTAHDSASIDAVRERLAADVGTRASLATIARDAGYSPFHLARRFRTRTGTSLHQYRLALRLSVALSMLREGAQDLTHLAYELGFASLAHFSTAFRTAYGYSPSTILAHPPPYRHF